ncbi:MAG: sialate O-acetylesterase [Ruminococcus callidus]
MIHCAAIFTDHMLLQRGKSIAVFGTGTAGEPVTVSVPQRHCTVSSAVQQDGTWRVTLPPMPAGTGCTLTVNEQEFSDVAFEVYCWRAVQYGIYAERCQERNGGTGTVPELQRAVFSVPRTVPQTMPTLHGTLPLELPDPETSGTWSAAAYLAAKELAHTQGVPVGIIGCNYGGSSVSCWLPESDLQAHTAGHPYLQDYADAAAGKTDAEMIAEYDEYVAYHTAWESRMQKCYQEDSNMPWDEIIRRCGENRYPGPLGIKSPYRPAGMYHTMLQRVVPYTIRGFFYYQGENDEIRPDTYGTLLTMLIARWRQDFEDARLPFILVQLPMHTYADTPENGREPAAEAQMQVYQTVKHTGIAVILDCGEYCNIHPVDKHPVGHRLALQARQLVYGERNWRRSTDLPQLRCGGQYADGVLSHAAQGMEWYGTCGFRSPVHGVSRRQSSAGRRHGAVDGGRSAGSCCGTVQPGELRCSYAVREKRDSGGTVPDGSSLPLTAVS